MATQCTFNNGSCLLRTEGLAFKPGSAQICAILVNMKSVYSAAATSETKITCMQVAPTPALKLVIMHGRVNGYQPLTVSKNIIAVLVNATSHTGLTTCQVHHIGCS